MECLVVVIHRPKLAADEKRSSKLFEKTKVGPLHC